MSQENQDFKISHLLLYANNLEQILFKYAKYDVLRRKDYERKVQNLAQLSINKGIDIDDIVKEINQEKKNEKIIENVTKCNDDEDKKNIKEIEIENISNQIFCEDFYNNLFQYLKRKKEYFKINHLFNSSKNNYSSNSNKYKMEQNNNYESKKNTIYIPNDSAKTNNLKTLGKKRKSK